MNFRREGIRDPYIEDTCVENIFILEYMPEAEGLFVKIYLTALMFAGNEEMSNERLARHLNVSEEDVLRAWNYWEGKNVIRKHYGRDDDRFHYEVEFLSLKERLYSPQFSKEEADSRKALPVSEMDDEKIRRVFGEIQEITGRMIEGREPESIISWIYKDGLEPEYVTFAYRFCREQRGNTGFRYVESVIGQWLRDGVDTLEKAEKLRDETDRRILNRKRVMQAMGFRRNPTESECSKIDSWFSDMNFSMDKVLEACSKTSGISNPNINYVHTILSRWHGGENRSYGESAGAASGSDRKNAVQMVRKSYDETQKRHREEQEKHIVEIHRLLPEVAKIESQLRDCSIKLSRAAISGGDTGEIRSRIAGLAEEKNALLRKNGYPEDYMELGFDCPECKDTGIKEDGSRCSCFTEKLKQFAGV